MKKTLSTIQGLMRLGRVLTIITLVFSIIGMVGCAVGGVALYATGDLIIETEQGDITLGEFVYDETMATMEMLYFVIIVAFFACMTEVIISDRMAKYFKFELSEGTPFTFEGAKKLKKVGILAIVLPIVVEIVAAVIAVFLLANVPEALPATESTSTEITYASSLGTGVMMLIFSLIFKHGAELNEAQKKANMEKDALAKKAEQATQRRGYYY
ncbi:MAG: hypothetical protein IJ033_00840 [Clostridia bacterium]|nr:hypothetical protein [Clostridia bacterium]